jgi:regulatory protein
MRRQASERNAPPQEAAREKCLRLLAVRARSAAELRDRLRGAGFAEEVIENVLGGLGRAGLVDDEEFARSWVASRRGSGTTGRRRLRWELRRKGVPEELIRRTVDEEIDEEEEFRRALDLAQRRLRGEAAEPKALSRLQRLLLSRGFGFETVDKVMRRLSVESEQ